MIMAASFCSTVCIWAVQIFRTLFCSLLSSENLEIDTHTFKSISAGSETRIHSVKDKLKLLPKGTPGSCQGKRCIKGRTLRRHSSPRPHLWLRRMFFFNTIWYLERKWQEWAPFCLSFKLCHWSANWIADILIYTNWERVPMVGTVPFTPRKARLCTYTVPLRDH